MRWEKKCGNTCTGTPLAPSHCLCDSTIYSNHFVSSAHFSCVCIYSITSRWMIWATNATRQDMARQDQCDSFMSSFFVLKYSKPLLPWWPMHFTFAWLFVLVACLILTMCVLIGSLVFFSSLAFPFCLWYYYHNILSQFWNTLRVTRISREWV